MKRAALLVAVLAAASLVSSAGATAPQKRQLRVGYVEAVSPGGYVVDAFVDTAADLGMQARVVFVAPGWGWRGPLVYLARQRYDLVVVGCCPFPPELASIAREFPRVKFLLPDQPAEYVKRPPKNLTGTVYPTSEASYLAGYLAALMERRRPGKDVIGWVGGYKVRSTVGPSATGPAQAGRMPTSPF